MPRKRRKTSTLCPNCDHEYLGASNFCPNCGQENHHHKVPFWHLVYESIENLTHFDSKFFTTIKEIFISPGLMTKNYNEGKRARYVPPVRLYVFTSVLYLFVTSFQEHGHEEDSHDEPQHEMVADTTHKNKEMQFELGTEGKTSFDLSPEEEKVWRKFNNHQLDSAIRAKLPNGSWFLRYVARKGVKAEFAGKGDEIGHIFMHNFIHAMLLVMPFFAGLLALLLIRRKMYFVDHLIFSVHYHSAFFVFLILSTLFDLLFHIEAITSIISIGGWVYMLPSLHRVYGGAIWKNVVRFFSLTILYGIVLAVGAIIVLFISLG